MRKADLLPIAGRTDRLFICRYLSSENTFPELNFLFIYAVNGIDRLFVLRRHLLKHFRQFHSIRTASPEFFCQIAGNLKQLCKSKVCTDTL